MGASKRFIYYARELEFRAKMKFIFPKKYSGIGIVQHDCSFAYFGRNPFLKWVFLQRLRLAASCIPERKIRQGRVLDIGTGCGIMLPTLSRNGKVTALDFEFEFLKKAKTMSHGNEIAANFVNGDISRLPFADKRFSLVNALSVIEHVKNVDEVMAELRRIIKDDGILIVGIPVERFLVNMLFSLLAFKDNLMSGKLLSPKSYKRNKYQDPHFSDMDEIEAAISKHFKIKLSKKMFSNYLPDSLSLYKVYQCTPK
ncbi:class I SAM-dependent methyltransferase [Candidatus Woesearchaeota archaeon]|nr:class I SAM-dependent methyltransferase [Candidatus Woesearchaeota archaeon]